MSQRTHKIGFEPNVFADEIDFTILPITKLITRSQSVNSTHTV